MPQSTEITQRSTVETCIRLINETFESVKGEYEDVAEDELFTDLAESMLIEAKRSVAEEVCRTQIGFVPTGLIQIWKQRDEARAQTLLQRSRDRYERDAEKKKADRAAEAEAAIAAERLAVKARTCPKCFTLRAPSGACNC